jgi:LysM repeat protein
MMTLLGLLGLWLAWQQGWRPGSTLINFSRQNLVYLQELTGFQVLLGLENLPDLPLPAELTTIAPIIVGSSTVIESPHSPAYTFDLYTTSPITRSIPWPNVAGRTRVLTYTVQPGDTLLSIAYQFELDLDTLRWSNPTIENDPNLLALDQVLFILPVPGVYHFVVEGDTLATIAARYGVSETDILNYPPNGLYPPDKLKPGQGIIVPFGRKDSPAPPPPSE